MANSSSTGYNKIYFSYSKSSKAKTTGEDKLEKYFESKGYKVIYPERHSLDEQLNILVNCESFASTVGSCSHSSVFLRDNTEVILIPRASYMNSYQLALDQVHNLMVSYIDSSFSVFTLPSPWSGSFLFFISSNLRKFFNDKDTNSIVSAEDFMKYFKRVFGIGFSLSSFGGANRGGKNAEAYKYYSVIAPEYFGRISDDLEQRNRTRSKIRNTARRLKGYIKSLITKLH